MSAVELIATALKIVSAIVTYFQNKKLVDDALAVATLAHLNAALQEISDAKNIRARVASDAAAHPERVRDDDGFRRD